MFKEGDLVKVINSRSEYNNRIAKITSFHLKDVSIEFVDNKDKISLRYSQIEKLRED